MINIEIRHKLKIGVNVVDIMSPFGERVFTIWRDDFDMYREAFKKCEEYYREQKDLDNKYKGD